MILDSSSDPDPIDDFMDNQFDDDPFEQHDESSFSDQPNLFDSEGTSHSVMDVLLDGLPHHGHFGDIQEFGQQRTETEANSNLDDAINSSLNDLPDDALASDHHDNLNYEDPQKDSDLLDLNNAGVVGFGHGKSTVFMLADDMLDQAIRNNEQSPKDIIEEETPEDNTLDELNSFIDETFNEK